MRWRTGAAILILVVVATACTASESPEPAVIEVWFHQAEGPQRSLLEDQVRRFNEQRDGLTVLLRVLSEVSYPQQVAEAAELEELPDLLDVSRTMLAAGMAGPLRSVGSLLPSRVTETLRPELVTVGTVGRDLVAVPLAAHVVMLGVEPDTLREERLPVPGGAEDPWTLEELEDALVAISSADEPALQLPSDLTDLGLALESLVRSAGGTVVSGAQPDPAGTTVATVVGRWLDTGLATHAVPQEEGGDSGLPLVLGGSDVLPDDLVVSPPPDFGAGVASVPTGFAWAVPEGGEHEAAVIEFLSFLLQPEELALTAEVTGGAPVIGDVLEQAGRAGAARRGRLVAGLLVDGLAAPIRAEPLVAQRLDEFATAVLAVGRGERDVADALTTDG